MMLLRGWDHFVTPLAEKAAATDRTAWSDEPFQISSLALKQLPDVGPRSDSSAWLKIHAELADEMKSSNNGQVSSLCLFTVSSTARLTCLFASIVGGRERSRWLKHCPHSHVPRIKCAFLVTPVFPKSASDASATLPQGFEFILYGDSITETWRGTEFAEPIKRAEGGQVAFERYWGDYRTAALAIAGDVVFGYSDLCYATRPFSVHAELTWQQLLFWLRCTFIHVMLQFCVAGDCTGHLLWRLQNGELPDRAHQPKAVILLIGTNDLGALDSVKSAD